MRPNPQETVDLVTFTEEILNGKIQFLCSVEYKGKTKKWTLEKDEENGYFTIFSSSNKKEYNDLLAYLHQEK